MDVMPSGPSAKARSRAVTRERRRPPDALSPKANKVKIAAIGLHVSHGITQHGFALNVDPDLDHYRHIIPCGIKARGVTSMGALLREPPSMAAVRSGLIAHAGTVFGTTLKVNSRP